MDGDIVGGRETRYRLGGLGIESSCRRECPHPSRPALGPTQPLYDGYRVILGGKPEEWWL